MDNFRYEEVLACDCSIGHSELGGAAVLGLATIALTGAFAASGAQASTAAPAAVSPSLIALSGSLPATTDRRR